MTTQYGGARACRPHMGHCILFRASPDRGQTWYKSIVMRRLQCPPGKACRQAIWQNDPVLAVSRSGVPQPPYLGDSVENSVVQT